MQVPAYQEIILRADITSLCIKGVPGVSPLRVASSLVTLPYHLRSSCCYPMCTLRLELVSLTVGSGLSLKPPADAQQCALNVRAGNPLDSRSHPIGLVT